MHQGPPRKENPLQTVLEELKQSNETLRQVQAQLVQSEKLAALGEMASGIAHELKNPLGIIVQAVYRLEHDIQPDSELYEVLQMIRQAADRSNRIIQNLLEFARPMDLNLETLKMRDLLNESLDEALHAHSGSVEIFWSLPTDLPAIQGDATVLRHTFINLFSNALQAMTNGDGSLEIHCELREMEMGAPDVGRRKTDLFEPGQVVLSCRILDSGEGIAEADLDRLFQPFFTTRPPREGTGLGLALVKSWIEGHGGQVTIANRETQGAEVTVLLPLGMEGDANA